MIFQGQEAEQKIIKFAENFINLRNYHKQNDKTQNMDYVVGEHPCKRPFHLVKKKDYEMDYYDLINSVQRHTKCFFHSCMSPITDDAKRTFKCRFNFPKPIAPVSTLKYEKKKTRNQGQQRVLCDQTRDEKE